MLHHSYQGYQSEPSVGIGVTTVSLLLPGATSVEWTRAQWMGGAWQRQKELLTHLVQDSFAACVAESPSRACKENTFTNYYYY